MSDSSFFIIGLLLGGAAVGGLIALIVLLARKGGDRRTFAYDERQLLVRGRAYRLSYWVLVAYMGVALLAESTGLRCTDAITTFLIGFCLSITVLAVACMRGDAYLALTEKPRTVALCLGFCTLANYGLGALNLVQGRAVVNGVLTYRGSNLVVGAMSTVVLAALLAHMGRLDREGRE